MGQFWKQTFSSSCKYNKINTSIKRLFNTKNGLPVGTLST